MKGTIELVIGGVIVIKALQSTDGSAQVSQFLVIVKIELGRVLPQELSFQELLVERSDHQSTEGTFWYRIRAFSSSGMVSSSPPKRLSMNLLDLPNCSNSTPSVFFL